VERCVENRDLRGPLAENLAGRLNAPGIIRVVEGSQIDTRRDAAQYFVTNEHRFAEQLSALHNSVTFSMDVSKTLNLRYSSAPGSEPAGDMIQCGWSIA
jgi:hypothetical protein